MQMGLHVYGQKPLTHDVAESRALTEFAKENKLMTQMGIQIHSSTQYRTAVQIVHDGVIGKVKEAHSFSNKRWGDANPKPNRKDPVPEGLDWDAWIGPAPYTDFIKGYYHPGQWLSVSITEPAPSGTWVATFMTRLQGFGPYLSHIPPFRRAKPPNKDNWGFDAKIHYVFPKTSTPRAKSSRNWYDGGQRPPAQVTSLLEGKTSRSRFGNYRNQGDHAHSSCRNARTFPQKRFFGR